ncbi:hypothetical protein M9435_005232 [Picochlorum sp. BPE23]|nr:hypothetical protein M9435_005232 [Picochlorum sp. BPE23]
MDVCAFLREFGDQLPRTVCAMQSPDSAVVEKESHGEAIKNCFDDLEKEIKSSTGHGSAKPPIYKNNNTIEKKPSLGQMPSVGAHPLDVQQGGQPSRQTSLGADFGLLRTKTSSGSQNVFNEVLDQLTSQEESLPRQASLYTLPSMTFLESLLDEMDSRNTSQGILPPEPPLYWPVECFDLPELDLPANGVETLEQLGLQSPQMPRPKEAYSCPAIHNNSSNDSIKCERDVDAGQPPSSPFMGIPYAPTAGSAAPSPQKASQSQKRQQSSSFEDDEEEYLEYLKTSMQTSKSGRCRKVANFVAGQKRKSHAISQFSAPAEYGNRKSLSGVSHQTKTLQGEAEVVSAHLKKTQKVRKGKATVCLNCGSTETPQWRCGPLGPRTLCNACGVRYKKGLPLSCWPLRNGMILPPGAELPPNIIVPEGMTIVTQPARQY